ncbi:MAG: SurA N-terminal domain-containing protein [Bacteroidia bacterium]|nr:SurA N-terminal domain-containing protein [Bacteroidia bacterium]
MTTLERIRNRAGLLVGVVMFALIAFVLGDFLKSGRSFFGDDPTKMGTIGSKEIDVQEFEAKLDVAKRNMQQQQQKGELDDASVDMLRNQVWNQIVYETVMTKQFNELGLQVGTDELFDMVQGKNPHPQVVQAFTDPKTGQFSPGTVVQFLNNLDKNPEGKAQWLDFEKGIKAERLSNKYNTLVKAGMYITKAEAQDNYVDMNRLAKFQYVTKRYSDVLDSTVKFDDSDLKTYYNAHKNKYKQEDATRSFDYVVFEPTPSAEDLKAANDEIAKIATEYAATKEDSAFVLSNSDVQPNLAFVKKGTVLGPIMDSMMFRATVGYVYGPYNDGASLKVAKLMNTKNVADSVKARHILIKPIGGDMAKAKVKADSLKKMITDKKMSFEILAAQASEDEGSKVKGGDLGWFQDGMMVKPFNDACFAGKVGDLTVVESQFGVHIIQIMGKGAESKRVQVGIVERAVRPSNKTYQSVYAKASDFSGKNTTAETFDKAIVDGGLNKRIASDIKQLDRNIPGVNGARELIKWAYTAEKNAISSVFEADGKYVIAKLTNVKDKGIATLEAVKEQVEIEVRKEKKAEQFLKEIEGATTLEVAATKLKSSVQTADNTNFGSGYIPGLGREVDVTAFVFAGKKGTVSKGIKGENGVYMVKVETITEAKPTTDNYKQNKDMLNNQMKQRADYELFNALKDKIEIKDNRAKFM